MSLYKEPPAKDSKGFLGSPGRPFEESPGGTHVVKAGLYFAPR